MENNETHLQKPSNDLSSPKSKSKRLRDWLKRMRTNYPKFYWSLLLSFILGFFLFIVKVVIALDRYIFHIFPQTAQHEHHHFYPELEHIDIVGILIGLAGLIFAVLISLVIEEIKDVENEELKDKIAKLSYATVSTQNVAETILAKFTALEIKMTLSQRIDSILEIIKLSKESNNDLYILSNSANHGHLQCHNFKTVITEGKKLYSNLAIQGNSPKDFPIYDFHHYWFRTLREKKDKINGALRDFARQIGPDEKKHRINMAILKSSPSPTTPKTHKYKRLLDKIIKEEMVLPYYKFDGTNHFADIDGVQLHDIYTFPEANRETTERTIKDLRNIFVDYILKQNLTEIEKLTQSGLNIHFLDNVPFQFFASIAPDTSNPKVSVQKCLIEFTNIHAIGEPYGVIAFESQNPEIIQSLKAVFKNLTANRSVSPPEVQDASVLELRELFHLGKEVAFVIKTKDLTLPEEDTKSFNPEVDILFAEGLKRLMWEKDKDNLEIYPVNLTTSVGKEEVKKDTTERTFISVGLFGNELSEWIGSESFDGHQFILGHDTKNIEHRLKIIRRINEKNELKIPYDSEDDYGVMFKTSIAKNTVIVIGAANATGTEQLGNYICKEWATIYNHPDAKNHNLTIKDNNFIMFFKIHKDKVPENAKKSKKAHYHVSILKETVSVILPENSIED